MLDDLDRCSPERIIEILEVIKLFLAVERTTFIIAADENVIKYSIRVAQSHLEQESFSHLITKIFEEKLMISGDVITLEEINKLIDELKLIWKDGDKMNFNETAKVIDEIREIVASSVIYDVIDSYKSLLDIVSR